MSVSFTLGELAKLLDARLVGDAEIRVSRIADLSEAGPDGVSFVSNSKFSSFLSSTSAAAVILEEDLVELCPVAVLIVKNPYLAYAKTAKLFDKTPVLEIGIAATAVIDETAKLGNNIAIAANVCIGREVVIADNVQIASGCVIGEGSFVGESSILKANVSIYHGVRIGKRVLIHSGSVIGSDGFGFANEDGCWQKIAQLGGVLIGDDVEIGANCTVDRGALMDTQIGNGVKLDNMVQIAHNVIIGDHCAMAAFVGVAGSTIIGEGCTLAGGVGIIGHLNIPAGSHFTVRTLANKSPVKAGIYSSGTSMQENKHWLKSTARFKKLNEMSNKIKKLERKLKIISKQQH